tara:strand:- start:69 stop:299 length:231 start_codon:yes stop_codon:yes gene_type:complete
MSMNSVQQVTYDYMVSEYHRGRPEDFSEANSFDLFTIHMMREITELEVSQETKEVADNFSNYVKEYNIQMHKDRDD